MQRYSIKPALLGVGDQPAKPFVYHEYCQPNENPNGWGQAVRAGNWSGVCVGEDLSHGFPACTAQTFLLYDLAADVGQKSSVAEAHPPVVQQLLALMKEEHEFNAYCGASPTPTPTPPAPPANLTGRWAQGKDDAPMDVLVANLTTDPATKAITGDVTLTCTPPCSCCNWRTATGTVAFVPASARGASSSDPQAAAAAVMGAGVTSLHVTAVGPGGFETHEDGTATQNLATGELAIEWVGRPKQWANWVKHDGAR